MIVFCFGTRPEIIKISPIIKEFQKHNIKFKTIFTGQHKELFEDVKFLIPEPDYKLNIMREHQTLNDILASISTKLPEIFKEISPDLLIVQGDTSTVLSSAIVAFNLGIKIGHVEAGLRTHNLTNPFPEEGNRQLVSRIANFNWAPTQQSCDNLKNEGINNYHLVGNTVIDTCSNFNHEITYGNKILVTLHRRENFGSPLEKMIKEIEYLASQNRNLEFIFPMHPNPNVQQYKSILKHVKVIPPLSYPEIVKLISQVKFVISDSGGIQEECAAFNKKILVCRKNTERPEGVEAGFAKLVYDDIINNFSWANDSPIWEGKNPYGDGKTSEKIASDIIKHFNY